MPTHEQAPQPRSEFDDLGRRLVRFGQALQQGSTTVGELTRLAMACGISFKLRVVGDSETPEHESMRN